MRAGGAFPLIGKKLQHSKSIKPVGLRKPDENVGGDGWRVDGFSVAEKILFDGQMTRVFQALQDPLPPALASLSE